MLKFSLPKTLHSLSLDRILALNPTWMKIFITTTIKRSTLFELSTTPLQADSPSKAPKLQSECKKNCAAVVYFISIQE